VPQSISMLHTNRPHHHQRYKSNVVFVLGYRLHCIVYFSHQYITNPGYCADPRSRTWPTTIRVPYKIRPLATCTKRWVSQHQRQHHKLDRTGSRFSHRVAPSLSAASATDAYSTAPFTGTSLLRLKSQRRRPRRRYAS
jgi:hypothetical protein